MTTLDTVDQIDHPTRSAVSVEGLDHVVLTVADVDRTIGFYCGLLGMRHETFGDGCHRVVFGEQALNLHALGAEPTPNAASATPGSADLCLITTTPVEGVMRVVEDAGLDVEQGPVERSGATGRLLSVYLRDPDGNLVELANRLED